MVSSLDIESCIESNKLINMHVITNYMHDTEACIMAPKRSSSLHVDREKIKLKGLFTSFQSSYTHKLANVKTCANLQIGKKLETASRHAQCMRLETSVHVACCSLLPLQHLHNVDTVDTCRVRDRPRRAQVDTAKCMPSG